MKQTLIGIVCRGAGQGYAFTQLDWVRRQFRDKMGFEPYPGTLNLRVQNRLALMVGRAQPGILIEPAVDGFCAARAFRVLIRDSIAAAWIVPDVPGYPDNLVELMAPVSLRDALKVKDGDWVEIKILGEGE